MLKKHQKTWLLVADGARARFFILHFHALESALAADLIHDHRPSREAITDKPGRALESDHLSRHTYEPRSDWHTYQKHVFANEISQILIEAEKLHEFHSLILIAPPKILGEIRKHLPKPVSEKVTMEIAKDLTKFTDQDLKAYLDELIVW
ncbi:MAG: host attachment protein [Alphaproteobacteria bacterium]|nr:host attachment protein [Alphaproteobacteria bacterium]